MWILYLALSRIGYEIHLGVSFQQCFNLSNYRYFVTVDFVVMMLCVVNTLVVFLINFNVTSIVKILIKKTNLKLTLFTEAN